MTESPTRAGRIAAWNRLAAEQIPGVAINTRLRDTPADAAINLCTIAADGPPTVPALGTSATNAVVVVFVDGAREELFRYDGHQAAVIFPGADGGSGPMQPDWDLDVRRQIQQIVLPVPPEDPVLALLEGTWRVDTVEVGGIAQPLDAKEPIVAAVALSRPTQPVRDREEQVAIADRCGRLLQTIGAAGGVLQPRGPSKADGASPCAATEETARSLLASAAAVVAEGTGLRVTNGDRSLHLTRLQTLEGTFRIVSIRAKGKPVKAKSDTFAIRNGVFASGDGCNTQGGNATIAGGRFVFVGPWLTSAAFRPKTAPHLSSTLIAQTSGAYQRNGRRLTVTFTGGTVAVLERQP